MAEAEDAVGAKKNLRTRKAINYNEEKSYTALR